MDRVGETDLARGTIDDGDNYNGVWDVSLVRASPNVTDFDGKLVLYSDKFVEYFIHKLPKLATLRLNNISFEDYVYTIVFESKISIELMVKFFQYILKISDASVDLLYIKETPDFLKAFLSGTSSFDGLVVIEYRLYVESNASTDWADQGPRIKIDKDPGYRLAILNTYNQPTIKLIFEYSPFVLNEDSNKMPHLDVIKAAGKLIKSLCLKDFHMLSGTACCIADEHDRVGIIVKEATNLTDIFMHCTCLKTLKIENYSTTLEEIILSADLTTINHSIEKLSITTNKIVHYSFLTKMSVYLPSLTEMDIEFDRFTEESTCSISNSNSSNLVPYTVSIIMSATSFNRLSIECSNTNGHTSICVEVTAYNFFEQPQYYISTENFEGTLMKCSKWDYIRKFWKSSSCLAIYIECKDIKKLQYKFGKSKGETIFSANLQIHK